MPNYITVNDVAAYLNYNNAGTSDVAGSGFVGGFPGDNNFRTVPSSGQVARRIDYVEKWIDQQTRNSWTTQTVTNEFHDFCLTGDSKVLTKEQGLINISDIIPGLTAISYENGKLIEGKIKNVYNNGIKKTYNVRLHSRNIKATTNHRFLVAKSLNRDYYKLKYKLEWVPLENLQKNDILLIQRSRPFDGVPYKINIEFPTSKYANGLTRHITVPKETTEDLMYFLGVYLGDGCRNKNSTHIAEFNDTKINKLKQIIKNTFNLNNIKFYPTTGINIGSRQLVTLISRLGFDGNAHTKRVPQWVFTLPTTQIKVFIDGYVSADGHINKKFNSWTVTSVSRELIEDIRNLCNLVGIRCGKISRYIQNTNFQNNTVSYRLQGGFVNPKRWYSPIRKHETVDNISLLDFYKNNISFEKIREIETSDAEPVFDLEIDNNAHNFVANGIIVHNSYWRWKPVRWRSFFDEGSVHLRFFPIRSLSSAAGDKLEVFTGQSANDGYEDYLTTKTQGRNDDFWVDTNEGIIHFSNSRPSRFRDAVRVTYRYGETTVPEDIKYAAVLLTAAQIVSTDDYSIVMPAVEGGGQNFPYRDKVENWRAEATEIIDFRRRIIWEAE